MRVRGERGYVLLEALVALLIFSLGLLGMIGFQAASTGLPLTAVSAPRLPSSQTS
jgi:Tfp pilus assembly protein PilV